VSASGSQGSPVVLPRRIAVGSDEKGPLTDAILALLRERGIEVALFGALAPQEPTAASTAHDAANGDADWPLASARVARAVADGTVERGIVCCWTGTGASIAANKIPGVRAALCGDAETARGSRTWNDANVLALSLRATTPAIGREIVTAWLETPAATDAWNVQQLARLRALEEEAQAQRS